MTEPTKAVPQSNPAPAVAAPPAATTVINADVTEETLKLRQELDAERAARRKIEQDHASVSDEFHRYKDATEARAIPVQTGKVDKTPRYRFLRSRG